MSVSIKKYSIHAEESIQDIAQTQLGDRDLWIDIVGLNRLRRPYISQSLPDQFGPMIGTLQLQQGLTKGDTQLIHWDATIVSTSLSLLAVGNILLFTSFDSAGDPVYDSALISNVVQTIAPGSAHLRLQLDLTSISNYNSSTRTMSLSSSPGMQSDHTAGEVFQVYGSPFLVNTVVFQMGDSLSLPVTSTNQSGGVSAISVLDIVDSLGIDVGLSNLGQKFASASGDIGTVVGIDNVKQALRTRVNTVPGELGMHPDYGCYLQFYVGTNQDASWPALAKAL